MSGYRNEDGVYFDDPGCVECDWGERPCHCVDDPTICMKCGQGIASPLDCQKCDAPTQDSP